MAAERLLDMIPPQLRSVYEPLIEGKNGTHSDLKKYVKAADLLDAYLKCVTELSAGNKEFGGAKKQIEQSIQILNMPELDYFLENMAPSLEKTLDEIAED
jgi:5'-deoxynucleotidase